MRPTIRLAIAVLAVLALSLPAPAEDEAKPKASPPTWGAEDIILREKTTPKEWTIVTDEAATAAGKAMVDAVKALVTKEGIDDLDTAIEHVTIKNAAGAQVTLLLGDVDVDPKGLTAAVQELAKGKGWTYRELTTPMRFLLASGPEDARAPAIDAQIKSAVVGLTNRAFQRAQQAGRATSADGQRAALESAATVARAAISLEPKAGLPHLVLGTLAAGMAQATDDKAKWKEAADEYRLAFREDAVLKPEGIFAFQAMSQYGLGLLMQKTSEGNKEAKAVLTKALDYEKFDEEGNLKVNVRYNLACALSLLGEKADAIKQLEASLRAMKATSPQGEFDAFVNKHIPGDTDLDNIRGEPEFAEAIKRVTGGSTASGV